MASRLSEVCETLVEKNYGHPATQVFRTLAHQGRLNLYQLRQKCAMPMMRLKAVLLILINHDIVLWNQVDDTELPYYHVDWHAAYVLVRQSKILRLVESRHGKKARNLLQNIVLSGQVQVGDLENEYDLGFGSKRDSGVETAGAYSDGDELTNGHTEVNGHGMNGLSEDSISTVASFHTTLRSLLEDGFVMKVDSERDHVPAIDLEDNLKFEVITADPRTFKNGKITGPKTAQSYASAANSLKRKWQSEAEFSAHRDVASQGSIKQMKSSLTNGNKRRKVNGDVPNGYHDDDDEMSEDEEVTVRRLPHDMCIRVNFNKCMIALRTERLEQLADDHLGPVSAAVYGAALRAAEQKILSVRSPLRSKDEVVLDDEGNEVEDPSAVAVTGSEILDRLDKSLDLASTIEGAHSKANGVNGHHKKPRMVLDDDVDMAAAGIKREHYSDDEDDEPTVNGELSMQQRQKRLQLINLHLELLSEHAKGFLYHDSNKRTSHISFTTLTKAVLDAEIDSMVLGRCGKIAVRIVRLLREKGRLADTQIAGFCLKRLQDLRALLSALQFQGILEIQELPRENSRQPSRTIYLWHYAENSVRELFLQQSYHAMARTMERVEVERERFRGVIEKAESVKGREEAKLNSAERNLLKTWRATEERLLATLMRLDDVVMVLRDFREVDTSLTT